MSLSLSDNPQGVFHEGELYMHRRTNKRGPGEYIRRSMPDQHRDFFESLPLLFLGTLDAEGQPWTSPVFGLPGFVESPTSKELRFDAHTVPGDVLAKNLARRDAPVGILGIELPTRRRNRMNGKVIDRVEETVSGKLGFLVEVHQSFGNCPKYIQRRQWKLSRKFTHTPSQTTTSARLTPSDIALIRRADNFYIATASFTPSNGSNEYNREGIDVSHRGGLPGFVGVADPVDTTQLQRIAWPDYQGNNLYNTLGNIHVNPRTGLLFIDFTTGDLLQVAGHGRVLFAGDPGWADEEYNGINAPEANPQQRKVVVQVDKVVRHQAALPFGFQFVDYSPYNLPVREFGLAASAADDLLGGVRIVECVDVQPESPDVCTFVFRVVDGKAVDHIPGGYAMFDFKTLLSLPPQYIDDLIRTWTVSSAPGRARGGLGSFEITVKRAPGGLVSSFLHEKMVPGVKVRLLGTGGEFTFLDIDKKEREKETKDRKVLLLAGGIGITPFMSALRALALAET
ncbi:hypothetical protein BC937DRAFT_89611, partial [Endogone sp. FLAS-F59071]